MGRYVVTFAPTRSWVQQLPIQHLCWDCSLLSRVNEAHLSEEEGVQSPLNRGFHRTQLHLYWDSWVPWLGL